MSALQLNRYPSRSRATEAAAMLGALYGVGEAEVVLGNGSNEVILAIHLAFGGPGRKAVYFEPTYTVYRTASAIAGTEAVSIERADDFSIPPSAVEAAVRAAPSIVHLCSPNNPTGNEDPDDFVYSLAEAIPDALIVVDRAYASFGAAGQEGELIEKPNVVVVKTFSKAAGLAGLRIGYGLAGEAIAAAIKKALLPYNLDSVSIEAILVCLEELESLKRAEIELAVERDRIFEALLQRDRLAAFPSRANFVLFGPKGAGKAKSSQESAEEAAAITAAARALWEALLEESVLVRDCTSWPGLTGCLRVSAGLPEETDLFVDALDKAIARIDL